METENNKEEIEIAAETKPEKEKGTLTKDPKKFNSKDYQIIAVLISFALLFIDRLIIIIASSGFVLSDGVIAVHATLFTLGCALIGFSMVLLFIEYRKAGKLVFNVELICNMLALALWFIV